MEVKDTRIAYGAACTWWDDIHNVGSLKHERLQVTIPCCPHCHKVLFEMPDPETWWRGVDEYQTNGHPGYHDFVAWLKGRCYPNSKAAKEDYEKTLGVKAGY